MYKRSMQDILFQRFEGYQDNDIFPENRPIPAGEPVALRQRLIAHKIGEYVGGTAGVMTNLGYSFEAGSVMAEWTFAQNAYHKDIIDHEFRRMRNAERQGHLCLLRTPLNEHVFKVGARCVTDTQDRVLHIEGVGNYREPRSIALIQGIVHAVAPVMFADSGNTVTLSLSLNDLGRHLGDGGRLTPLRR